MYLTCHDSVSLVGGVTKYGDLSGDSPFKWESSVSSGYTDITSIENFRTLAAHVVGLSYEAFRNGLISDFLPDWSTMSDADKRVLVEHHVYPAATTTPQLDALFSADDRMVQRRRLVRKFREEGHRLQRSGSAGSEKLFCLIVNDAGVVAGDELATDVEL